MKLENNLEVCFALYRRVAVLREYAKRFTVQPGQGGNCPNCQDQSGYMFLYELQTESDEYQAGMIRLASGKFAHCKITGWPCPVCNKEKINETQERLTANSGLLGIEFEWSLDYYQGMKGKENLLRLGKALIKDIPIPTGFHTLHGGYGMGKSGMAKTAVSHMVKAGGVALYRRAADILEEIKSTFNNEQPELGYARTEAEAIYKYKTAQLLAVDEVDRTSQKEWSTSTIFTILDHRYNRRNDLCTLVITNQHPDKLDPSFGYLASRMKDGHRIAVGGRELRGS